MFEASDESVSPRVMGNALYTLHDVTDRFYTTSVKGTGKATVHKTELHKSLVNNIKKTEITVQVPLHETVSSLVLPIVFSDDLPARNTLKRLESLHPRMYIVTWMDSAHVLRYASIIQTDDAVSIWSNYFANQVLV